MAHPVGSEVDASLSGVHPTTARLGPPVHRAMRLHPRAPSSPRCVVLVLAACDQIVAVDAGDADVRGRPSGAPSRGSDRAGLRHA